VCAPSSKSCPEPVINSATLAAARMEKEINADRARN
jgi:hypothetical protein